MTRCTTGAFLAALLLTAEAAHSAQWRQFRGPNGLGISDETGMPTRWSATENIVWRARLPGAGTSSPIVVGERVFLTCYSGYGLDESEPGNWEDLARHVVCLDRHTGAICWSKTFPNSGKESNYSGNGARHGYSSSTPTSDGERLYVFFGKMGVYCFDLDGNQVWHASVGTGVHQWGSATSPVLFGDLLIVNASIESRSLVALDKRTGKETWRTPGINGSWNTPLLVQLSNGETELVLSVPEQVLGIDPHTGQRLWNCDGVRDRGYVCPSIVANEGIVYAIGGRQNTALAVRAGGRGDVTATHRLWITNSGSNVSSPVYHDGHLYWAHESRGVLFCLNAATGELVYQERLDPRPGIVYSSATLADGKLYVVSQYRGTYVLAASPRFRLHAHNIIEDDDSRCNACLVVDDGQLLLRSDQALYCIGKK